MIGGMEGVDHGIGLSLGCGSGFTGNMTSAMVILWKGFSICSVGRGGDTLRQAGMTAPLLVMLAGVLLT